MGGVNNGRGVRPVALVVAVAGVLCLPALAGAAVDGPGVRVTRVAPGRVVLEVADATVTVRKEVTPDHSTVTMTTPGDGVVLTVRRGVVSLSRLAGRKATEWQSGHDDSRLVGELGRSEAVLRARVLLSQVLDGPDTFVGQSLLLTRAILEAGTGATDAIGTYRRWVSERAAAGRTARGARVILASAGRIQLTGPGECWDLYAEEAIRIADDFAECTADLEWYEAHKWAGCSLIYAVRAEGAMAWFIACNGGVPFRG